MMCFVKNFFGAKNISNRAIALLLLLSTLEIEACGAAGKASAESGAPKQEMVLGVCTWEGWQKDANWDDYAADDYALDSLAVQRIRALAANADITFLIFGGSWCGDSRDGIPKIYKIFRAANIDAARATLYGVDRKKREETGAAEKFQIKRVPTLIVLKGGKEQGRIVEMPMVSWEKDLEELLSK